MGKKKYVFDSENFSVVRPGRKGRKTAMLLLKLFFASISLTVIYYVVFALLFSTDQERALQNENRMLERMYPEMERKAELLDEVVEGLKVRDMMIYEDIFETEAPELDRILSMNLMPLTDSVSEEDLVKLTEAKSLKLMAGAGRVESNMAEIMALLSDEGYQAPPMHIPIENFSLPMTGASVGRKMNPFYKVTGDHDGLDFMAPLGDEVLAVADGRVSQVIRSRRGEGNVVELEHENGFRTRYAHLQDISVKKGRQVKRGEVIGHVGMSGHSFAPHLHYEVWRDTVLCNPVNYFFGSVDPEEYADMSIVSVVTGQSLD